MRNVPAALQTHLNGATTTVTLLILIEPVTPGYSPVGATLLDRDVTYDDGNGAVTYSAAVGLVPANLLSTLDMDVDNTEFQSLLPEFDLPIAEADILAGVYDYAKCSIYLVNYNDLTMGHVVMGYGSTGQMRIEDGLSFWPEFTAQSKQLKQSFVEKDSLTCRATFGSMPLGTGGGVVEERFPCGKDTSTMWSGTGTVSYVAAEANTTFSATGVVQADGYYQPGMLKWLTGANAGRSYEVDGYGNPGNFVLTFETMFPVQIGDTFVVRKDCTKWKEEPNGCKTHFGINWVLHYRGEPYIPVADADQLNMPGAAVGGALASSTFQTS